MNNFLAEWRLPANSDIQLLTKFNVKLVKSSLNEDRFNNNVSSHKNASFRNHQTCKINDQCILWYRFMKFLLFCYIYLFCSDCKIFAESVNLRKFTAQCPDVLADKPHP